MCTNLRIFTTKYWGCPERNFYRGVLLSYGQLGVSRRKDGFRTKTPCSSVSSVVNSYLLDTSLELRERKNNFHAKNPVFLRGYILPLLALLLVSACSSPPKKTGDIFELRRRTESQLDMGNRQADRGSFEIALIFLDEAVRLAIAADDSDLRIRTRLSHSNVLFSLGRREEAAAGWNEALAEAERAGNAEWAAVCRVYRARGKLLSEDGKAAAGSLRDELREAVGMIKSDRFSIAFAWNVMGLAEKELGRYAEAEAAVRRGLEIHEKDLLFEMAAYDWYTIASFRSLSGDYRGAVQALENAVTFDRRVENSWGLASDWRAMGDVYLKTGDFEAARAAYFRSAEIFRALGNETAANQTLSRLENR